MRVPFCACLLAGAMFSAPAFAQPFPLTSGVPRDFPMPRATSPTLLSGANGFQIAVSSDVTRLEVKLSAPSNANWAIGVRVGSDFSTTTFNNQWGGIGGESPVVITRSSSPPLTSGTYFIGILLLSNPNNATATITATVSSGAPSISVGAALDLGSVTVGQNREQSLRVQNTGTQPLNISALTFSNSQFRAVSPSTPFAIVASGQQDITIRFQPTATGPQSATLTIRSDDPTRATVLVTLTGQGTAAAPLPVISTTSGVVNGASFLAGIASGSWLTIRGTDLASTTRIWASADFKDNRLPTSLDGVSVKINNRDALVYYISPTQINALAPSDAATGPVSVTVTNSLGTSQPAQASYQQYAPALFAFDPQNRIYPAAVHPDGTFVGRAGLFGTAATTVPARPGGRISLFGTGFGATNPAADPAIVLSGAAPLITPNNLRILINNVAATIEFAGMVSNGLYQINIVVPEVPDGDQTLVAEIGGQRSPSTMRLTILRPPVPALRYPQLTRQGAVDCPGAQCLGSVTVSPGEQLEFWIGGSNLQNVTGLRLNPADGTSINILEATSTVIRAAVNVSPSAALGRRQLVASSPAGDSNMSPGVVNLSTFRISNLRVENVTNSDNTLTFQAVVDYSDPTGSVSSASLGSSTSLAFGSTIQFIPSGTATPSGRTPGATSGTMIINRSHPNISGTTGAFFQIRLTAADGRESDNLGKAF